MTPNYLFPNLHFLTSIKEIPDLSFMLKWIKLLLTQIQFLFLLVHQHNHIGPVLTPFPCKESNLLIDDTVCFLLLDMQTVNFLDILVSHFFKGFLLAIKVEMVSYFAFSIFQE